MSDLVRLDVEEGIATITINRPEKKNAMNRPARAELRVVFEEAEANDDIRVIVLRGAGSEFSAGGDLEFYSQLDMVEGLEYVQKHVEGLYTYIERFPVPTIAAVHGYALGGGTELAMACDIRLASTEAKFGLTESRVGLYPTGGGGQRLVRLVGLGRAKELVYTGDIIDAEDAVRIGLVNHVYEPEEFNEKVTAFAEKLVNRPPLALSLAKESIHRGLNMEAGLGIDRVAGGFLFGTEDQKEGARAFLEDREPEFHGK
jgi:enoyl-CoA hydratase